MYYRFLCGGVAGDSVMFSKPSGHIRVSEVVVLGEYVSIIYCIYVNYDNRYHR